MPKISATIKNTPANTTFCGQTSESPAAIRIELLTWLSQKCVRLVSLGCGFKLYFLCQVSFEFFVCGFNGVVLFEEDLV